VAASSVAAKGIRRLPRSTLKRTASEKQLGILPHAGDMAADRLDVELAQLMAVEA